MSSCFTTQLNDSVFVPCYATVMAHSQFKLVALGILVKLLREQQVLVECAIVEITDTRVHISRFTEVILSHE